MGLALPDLQLVAMANTSSPRESAHTALYEFDASAPGILPEGHAVMTPAAFEGLVHPEVLTIILRRLEFRREARAS